MQRWLIILGVSCLLTPPTLAQPGEAGQVSGAGTVELKRPAEVLRVTVDLTAKGKDLKEALAKLKERREAAAAQLAGLGFAKKDVQFGETALTNVENDRQRQMEMMVMQRRGGRKPDAKKQPDPVVVGCSLKADLPLQGGAAEEVLIASHTLQEKIKAADLGGVKDAEKGSPKDEELAEEMQEMARMMHEAGGPKPGEPTFVYVCKIAAADRDKALKEAYQKATAQATRLAQAAGVELGPLHTLSSHSQIDHSEMNEMMPYYGRSARAYMSSMGGNEEDTDEAIGASPTKVTLRISVSAAFQIKKK